MEKGSNREEKKKKEIIIYSCRGWRFRVGGLHNGGMRPGKEEEGQGDRSVWAKRLNYRRVFRKKTQRRRREEKTTEKKQREDTVTEKTRKLTKQCVSIRVRRRYTEQTRVV